MIWKRRWRWWCGVGGWLSESETEKRYWEKKLGYQTKQCVVQREARAAQVFVREEEEKQRKNGQNEGNKADSFLLVIPILSTVFLSSSKRLAILHVREMTMKEREREQRNKKNSELFQLKRKGEKVSERERFIHLHSLLYIFLLFWLVCAGGGREGSAIPCWTYTSCSSKSLIIGLHQLSGTPFGSSYYLVCTTTTTKKTCWTTTTKAIFGNAFKSQASHLALPFSS